MDQLRQGGYVLSRHARHLSLEGRFGLALISVLSLTGATLAQSQSAPPTQSQTAKPAASLVDGARQIKFEQNETTPHKVFTNDDLAALTREGISITGAQTPTGKDSSPEGEARALPASHEPPDNSAKAAAYWKARFTAARQKLSQDEKTLPALQSQLELERVQECSVDEDTGQVYSDTFMNLLHQIDAMKLTIQEDKQALSDLHDEFRHAGGLPGWIRQ